MRKLYISESKLAGALDRVIITPPTQLIGLPRNWNVTKCAEASMQAVMDGIKNKADHVELPMERGNKK